MLNCLVVGVGGFIGSVMRYLIGLIHINESFVFPVKTFAVNIIGAFAIGIITALALKNVELNPRLVLFLKVGICGGFTTFSTFALESAKLFQDGRGVIAVIYIVLSAVLSVLAVLAAELLVKQMHMVVQLVGVVKYPLKRFFYNKAHISVLETVLKRNMIYITLKPLESDIFLRLTSKRSFTILNLQIS